MGSKYSTGLTRTQGVSKELKGDQMSSNWSNGAQMGSKELKRGSNRAQRGSKGPNMTKKRLSGTNRVKQTLRV